MTLVGTAAIGEPDGPLRVVLCLLHRDVSDAIVALGRRALDGQERPFAMSAEVVNN
jgi:hypothetical protein